MKQKGENTKSEAQQPVEVSEPALKLTGEEDIQKGSTKLEEELSSSDQKMLITKKFGTFSGVIRPTILTILGVMMYLREGWVVGNAGLGGAILIILTAYFITGTTTLSLSSITTNMRLGAGGVFSIATQSLGLEVGGSIGIPFYLAQALSAGMYLYGFMEGWLVIFPGHYPLLVVVVVFAIVFLVSFISTTLAFRVQVIVMSGILLALSSIFMGLEKAPVLQQPLFFGDFESGDFWSLFAVFFPAATGIMVGASMSGNLEEPRKSIPIGTITAWGVSLFVYLGLAVWYSLIATPEELKSNLTIAVDRAFWGPAVLIGILSSCFTAALSSFVASPRTLQALGGHRIVPFSKFFGKMHKDEPRNAILFTGGLILLALLLGDLNTIARVVTVFFLMTYFVINFILVIEHQLNLVSFRPTFKVPIIVPTLGSLACLSAIVIVSPFVGLTCILISLGIYIYLDRRALENPYETLNTGLFGSIANWAARKVAIDSDSKNLRSWKPDILLPIERVTQLEGNYQLLLALAQPQGSIQVIGFKRGKNERPLRGFKRIINEIQEDKIFASGAIIKSNGFLPSLRTSAAVLKSSFFQPNIMFVPVQGRSQEELEGIMEIAKESQLGVVFLAQHPDAGFGKSRRVNLWIRDQSPNWHLSFNLANIDLPLLLAYKLVENWKTRLRVISLVSNPGNLPIAQQYLNDLMTLARMPNGYSLQVESSPFGEFLEQAPLADLNIFGLGDTVSKASMEETVKATESTCLFVKNSGLESVLV